VHHYHATTNSMMQMSASHCLLLAFKSTVVWLTPADEVLFFAPVVQFWFVHGRGSIPHTFRPLREVYKCNMRSTERPFFFTKILVAVKPTSKSRSLLIRYTSRRGAKPGGKGGEIILKLRADFTDSDARKKISPICSGDIPQIRCLRKSM
jgi:hypothetical protein